MIGKVGRWWNGSWDPIARAGISVQKITTWRVDARRGDADSQRITRSDFATETDARTFVTRLMDACPGERRDMLDAGRGSADAGPHSR
ncbi:hypothetical protein GCM10009682_47140 [Luedemannella flava]|uniref:Uncharacterized protein n=1 Tax=Luedemannella flava TaxID=349316 RepID=A0ABP4YNL4_9ACTN